jgi:hypothetical protein
LEQSTKSDAGDLRRVMGAPTIAPPPMAYTRPPGRPVVRFHSLPMGWHPTDTERQNCHPNCHRTVKYWKG